MNPLYGSWGLQWLGEGTAAQDVVLRLAQADAGRAHRQVHVLAANGAAAAHTGQACVDWCGHAAGEGFSVAGNMLAGAQVLEATARAYLDSAVLPLAERLIAALCAGEAAGGDKRGKQSAALRIHADEDYPSLDIRVDDHEQPLVELRRLYDKSLERFQPFVACLAGRHDTVGLTDRLQIEAAVRAFQHGRRAP